MVDFYSNNYGTWFLSYTVFQNTLRQCNSGPYCRYLNEHDTFWVSKNFKDNVRMYVEHMTIGMNK